MPAIYTPTDEERAERRREASRIAYAKRKAERAEADALRERAGRVLAQGSRVVLDDDEDSHLPATPSYLAEQARRRAARAAEREVDAQLPAALEAQQAEAMRIIEQAANGELDLDDERAAAPATHAAVDTLKPRALCGDKAGRAWSRLSTAPTCERCQQLLAEQGPSLLDEYKAREADKRERTLRVVLPRNPVTEEQRAARLREAEETRDAYAERKAEREARELARQQWPTAVVARAGNDTVSKAKIVATLEVLVISSKRKSQRARDEGKGNASDYESGVTEGLQTALQLVSDLLAD